MGRMDIVRDCLQNIRASLRFSETVRSNHCVYIISSELLIKVVTWHVFSFEHDSIYLTPHTEHFLFHLIRLYNENNNTQSYCPVNFWL